MEQKIISVWFEMVNPFTANKTQLTWLNACDAGCICIRWEPWLAGTPYNLGLIVMECVQL
jgi:hypothetical protein